MRISIKKSLTVLTLLCFVLLSYFIFFPSYKLARVEYPWMYFLVGFLFFNTTHIFITFIKIFYFPEFKNLEFLKSKLFIFRCFAIFSAAALITYFCASYAHQNQYLSALLRIFIFGTTIHHTNMQTYGLSSQLELFNKTNSIEKKSVLIFTFFAVCLYTLARFGQYELSFYFVFALFFMWLSLSYYIIKNSGRSVRFDKFTFLSRNLCVFLSFVHPLITLVAMTFHGLEYLQTFLFLQKNSRITKPAKKISSTLLWFAIPSTALFIHFTTLSSLFVSDRRGILRFDIILESIVMGFNILHFFLDAKIYQFKNNEVKQNIAPLFKLA